MKNSNTEMRRRTRSLTLKLVGVGFIILMLIRTDWLANVFINSFYKSRPSRHKHVDGQSADHSLSNLDVSIYRNMEDTGDVEDKHEGRSIIREMMDQDKPREMSACSIPHLKNAVQIESKKAADCVRVRPVRSACSLAKKIFGDPSSLDIEGACSKHHSEEYCKITGDPDNWIVSCDVASCDKTIYLGIIDVTSGQHTWTPYTSDTELQKSIESHFSKDNMGYCLLYCGEEYDIAQHDDMLQQSEPQILNLPPPMQFTKVDQIENYINFNFIFIDSIARHHFYRSLPRSVRVLDSLAVKDKHDNNMMILDFELVQGVRSRTFETLQTLFAGSINPFEVPFGTQEMPREKLNIETVMLPLQRLGYSTLWQEDLCPFWEWGLSKDLLVYNSSLDRKTLFRKFLDATRRVGIGSLGNTFSSCDILKANGVPDPFHAPDKICYNGKHQHDTILEYLKTYQRTMLHRSQPFFSFLETNIGHQGSGKRIQYFDSAFADYLNFVKDMHNTFTIVLSDHGNAYGDFVKKSPEGRIEIYQPFMFMIIPENVQSFFTESQIHALTVNQHRLISVLDLHYTMTSVIEKLYSYNRKMKVNSGSDIKSEVKDFNHLFNVTKHGLLTEISPLRTCSHLPRIMPNLCICEGYDVSSSTSVAYHYILALYFVGLMNNEVQRQAAKGVLLQDNRKKTKVRQKGGFGHCRRMNVQKTKNIQESKHSGYLTTVKMDLYVKTPGQRGDEIFFINIQLRQNYSEISLSSFDRITPYSKYSKCADAGVDVKLCVCNIQSENLTIPEHSRDINHSHKHQHNVEVGDQLNSMLQLDLKHNITSIDVYGDECLYLIAQWNRAGVVYEALNNCKIVLKFNLSLKPVNLVLSTATSVDVRMLPHDGTFIAVGVRERSDDWSCGASLTLNM